MEQRSESAFFLCVLQLHQCHIESLITGMKGSAFKSRGLTFSSDNFSSHHEGKRALRRSDVRWRNHRFRDDPQLEEMESLEEYRHHMRMNHIKWPRNSAWELHTKGM